MATTNFTTGTTITSAWCNDVDAHVYDEAGTDKHHAVRITVTPAGNITSTNVEDAINEIDGMIQPLDATLTSIAALGTAADKYLYTTGVDTWAEGNITTIARALLDDADQKAMMATIGALISAVEAKSTNYTVTTSDRGKLFNCTDVLTLSLPAAATAGNGFAIAVRNSAVSGSVTIDPNGSETVDGSSTLDLSVGMSCLVVCNGSNWITIGKQTTTTQAFSAYAETAKTTVPAGSNLVTVTHGLGATPKLLEAWFECVSAEQGWSVNDTLVHPWMEGSGNYSGALYADATNVYYRVGSMGTQLPNKTTGSAIVITNANWKIFFRCAI